MPTNSLKSLAKKAGVSLSKAERYWKEAKASYEEKKGGAGDKWAYVMGTVKKRLGLEDIDLVLRGVPANSLLECDIIEEDIQEFCDSTEQALFTYVIAELARSELGTRSPITIVDSNGDAHILQSTYTKLDNLKEDYTMEDLRKILPGVPDDIIKLFGLMKSS